MSVGAPFVSGVGADGSAVSSNTDTQAFPTIPIEDDPTPANIAGFSLISDVADFARPLPGLEALTEDPSARALDYGRDLSFDFTTGEPTGLQSGSLTYVQDELQITQWIQKAITTPQGRYVICGTRYGSILRDITGQGGPEQTIHSEIARSATTCMLAHPRVVDATVDVVQRVPQASRNGIFISARLYLDSGEEPVVATMLTS